MLLLMFHKHPNPYFGPTTDGKPLDCILDVLNLMLVDYKFIVGIKAEARTKKFFGFLQNGLSLSSRKLKRQPGKSRNWPEILNSEQNMLFIKL